MEQLPDVSINLSVTEKTKFEPDGFINKNDMTQKKLFIVNAIPNTGDMQSFQSYLSQIVVIVTKFGASNMQRFKTTEQLMGQGGIKVIAVFEFPDSQSIKDMMASDDFTALNELRKKAFKQEVDLMICETM